MVTGTCYVVARLPEAPLLTCRVCPVKLPSYYLFFAFMKARERHRATWNLRRLIGKPLRKIGVIIVHNVEPRFFGKLSMVFGEHAVHLGDLFMGTKAFCNHPLYSTRCRQPPRFSWVSPASHKRFRVSRQHFEACPPSPSQQFARDPAASRRPHRAPPALRRPNQVLAACF